MANQTSDSGQPPAWAQTKPGEATNIVGIDLNKLSSTDLQKFISLMEEIGTTPASCIWMFPDGE